MNQRATIAAMLPALLAIGCATTSPAPGWTRFKAQDLPARVATVTFAAGEPITAQSAHRFGVWSIATTSAPLLAQPYGTINPEWTGYVMLAPLACRNVSTGDSVTCRLVTARKAETGENGCQLIGCAPGATTPDCIAQHSLYLQIDCPTDVLTR
jgi:hypothetical protein